MVVRKTVYGFFFFFLGSLTVYGDDDDSDAGVIYIYKQNKYYIHMVKREFSVDFKREFNYKNMFEYFFFISLFFNLCSICLFFNLCRLLRVVLSSWALYFLNNLFCNILLKGLNWRQWREKVLALFIPSGAVSQSLGLVQMDTNNELKISNALSIITLSMPNPLFFLFFFFPVHREGLGPLFVPSTCICLIARLNIFI